MSNAPRFLTGWWGKTDHEQIHVETWLSEFDSNNSTSDPWWQIPIACIQQMLRRLPVCTLCDFTPGISFPFRTSVLFSALSMSGFKLSDSGCVAFILQSSINDFKLFCLVLPQDAGISLKLIPSDPPAYPVYLHFFLCRSLKPLCHRYCRISEDLAHLWASLILPTTDLQNTSGSFFTSSR